MIPYDRLVPVGSAPVDSPEAEDLIGLATPTTPVRRAGQRNDDLSGEPTSKVLKTAKSLVRTDFGGQDAHSVLARKAAVRGLSFTPDQLDFIKKIAEDQVESCRRRAFPRIDEAIKRMELSERFGGNGSV